MEMIQQLIHTVLHLDDVLPQWAAEYGGWIYAILFLIVFCETGLVVTPFLPGDSLLFAAGAVAAGAAGAMNVHVVVGLLIVAAVLGDAVNYSVGKWMGDRVRNGNRFIKKEYLDRTHAFYEKYGAKTIILARFVPIVRTFAPFVAGVGEMSYRKFFIFNIVGAILWCTSLTYAGYAMGNIPWVKKNFEVIVLAIIFISILPVVFEVVKAKLESRKAKACS